MYKSPYIQDAFALADRKDTEQVSVLRDLLGIDTTNPPGAGYERMVEYLDFRFRRLGFRNQRIVVPGECTLIVNRRYTPGETEAGVTAEILAAVERGRAHSRAVDLTAQVIPGFPAFDCNLDNPPARRPRDAKKLVLGYKDEDFRQVASARSYGLGLVQQEMGLRDFYFTGVSRAEAMESDTNESCRLFDLFNLTKELIYYLSA